MQYIHKPTEVESIQLTPESFDEVIALIGVENINSEKTSKDECFVEFSTEADVRTAHNGDYVVKGVNGIVYPCTQDVFTASYDVKA